MTFLLNPAPPRSPISKVSCDPALAKDLVYEIIKKCLSAPRWLILVCVSLYIVHLAIFHRSSLFQSACGPCSDCSGWPSLRFTLPEILSSTEPPVWKLKKENIKKAEDLVTIIFWGVFSESGIYNLWCSPPNSATTDPLNQRFLIPSSLSRRLRNFLSFLGLILSFLFSFFPFFNLPAVDENVDTGVDDQ